MRRVFEFEVQYFKPSGKFYATGRLSLEVAVVGSAGPFMQEAVDHLSALRHRGPMPGLTGGWDGHILVDAEDGYPCLIPALPERA